MAFIYDINRNFHPGTEPALDTRGAYSFQPAEGSSNILSGGIKPSPLAGRYATPIQAATEGLGEGSIFNNPEYQKLSDKDKELYMRAYGPSSEGSFIKQFTSPEYMAQQEAIEDQRLQKGLAAYKQMGDQQMKYSLINRGLTGLSEGIRSALTRYPDPYMTANLTTGVAAAASRGAEAARGFTQLGAGNAPIKYFNV
jgi:hypothetical protein